LATPHPRELITPQAAVQKALERLSK